MGTGDIKDMDWLVRDMALELQCWGHVGGDDGHIIVKSAHIQLQGRVD